MVGMTGACCGVHPVGRWAASVQAAALPALWPAMWWLGRLLVDLSCVHGLQSDELELVMVLYAVPPARGGGAAEVPGGRRLPYVVD